MKTLISGTTVIILAGVLVFIIIYIIYWIGSVQYRRDYEKKYKYLEFVVEESAVNELTRKSIEKMFDEIICYTCRNKEKIHVLWNKYNKKFKKITI